MLVTKQLVKTDDIKATHKSVSYSYPRTYISAGGAECSQSSKFKFPGGVFPPTFHVDTNRLLEKKHKNLKT